MRFVLYHSDTDLHDEKGVTISGRTFAIVEVAEDGWHLKSAIKAMDGKMYSVDAKELDAFIKQGTIRPATEDETALFMLNDTYGKWQTT
jgi:hypothetical protein